MKKEMTKDEPVAEKKPQAAAQPELKEKMSENEGKVGGMLHDARLKKGLKIADIAKELYIRPAYLEAIESSNYDEIPEPPYGIGFIRSYAEFLGLNSSRIVQLFKEETDANSKADDVYVLEPQAEATVPNKKYLLVSLGAIAALYLAWFAYNESQNIDVEQNAEEAVVTDISAPVDDFPLQVEDFATVDETVPAAGTEQITVIDTTAAPVSATPQVVVNEGNFVEPAPAAEPAQTVVAEPVVVQDAKADKTVGDSKSGARIVLKVNKETWIEVKDKDKLWISKVLQPGDTYKIPAGSGKILSVGRYDGIEVLVDGKVMPVVTASKKTGIELDKYLEANH